MAGNKESTKRAVLTTKLLYGDDFYRKIAAIGAANGHTGGFTDRDLASRAGRLGGMAGKRKPASYYRKEETA